MKRLGALEAVVMQELWRADGPLSVREVLERLRGDRDLAYTTVMTVMDNLHGKGFTERTKEGRAYRYAPAFSREEHTASMLDEVLSDSPDRGAALMHFVGSLPDDEVAQLRAALSALDEDAP